MSDRLSRRISDPRNAKPGDKPISYSLGNGLVLYVAPTGTATWRCPFTVAGKKGTATLGRFLASGGGMSLRQAREAREAIRKQVLDGGDPSVSKAAARGSRRRAAVTTIAGVYPEWLAAQADKHQWTPAVRRATEGRFANHILPAIGERSIAEITTKEVETFLRSISERYRAQAVLIRQNLAGVFDYAGFHYPELCPRNPVRANKWLPTRVRGDVREQPRPAVKAIADARAVLALIEAPSAYASKMMVLGHRFLALTAVRKMEALGATWSEFSDDLSTWIIPAERMKGRAGQRRPHVVALSPQARECLEAARLARRSDGSAFVFYSPTTGRAFAASAMNDLVVGRLRKTPYAEQHCIHGWRTTFSTVLNEVDYRTKAVLDVMLAHKANVSAAEAHYNRAEYLDERRRLATAWADMLLEGAPSAFALLGVRDPKSNVVKLREAA